jgi:hypothetical protein
MMSILRALALGGMLTAGVRLLWPMIANVGGRGGSSLIAQALLTAVAVVTAMVVAIVFLGSSPDERKGSRDDPNQLQRPGILQPR